MESKRKSRKVRKASSAATPAQLKSQAQDKPTSVEALTRYNGELVESLFQHKAWDEIVMPLIQESIAGCSGRFTNGRFYKGSFTRIDGSINLDRLAGYQMALEELHNNLHDFIIAKNKLAEKKREEIIAKDAPIVNPFMEEEYG